MKLFSDKKEKNTNREVGSNFDNSKANEIFDALDKIDTTELKKSDKNIENQMKDISNLLKEAENSDDNRAIELYKKVLVIVPDNVQAYEGIANICRKYDDREGEIKILKEAVKNSDGNSKNNFMKRLKEIS